MTTYDCIVFLACLSPFIAGLVFVVFYDAIMEGPPEDEAERIAAHKRMVARGRGYYPRDQRRGPPMN